MKNKATSITILMKCSFVACLLTFFIHPAKAQSAAIIGAGLLSGTSSNSATGDPGPMYKSTSTSNFNFSRYNYLYTASELALAGITPGSSITTLSWFKDNNAAGNSPCLFQVWIKNSSLLTIGLGGQAWSTLISGASQVYSNSSHSVDNFIGWHEITFTAPFIYTGGALEISTNFDISQGASPWTTAGFSWKKDNALNVTLSYCGAAAPTALQPNLRTVRPQIKIGYSPFVGSENTLSITPISLSIAPNPANELISLTINGALNETVSIEIYSATFQKVMEENISISSLQKQLNIDVKNYPSGIYFVQLKNNSGLLTKKLIIE